MVQVTVVEETWQQQRDTAQQVPSPAKTGQGGFRGGGWLVHEGGSAVQCQYRHYEGCEAQPTANRGAKAQREGTPEYGHTGQQVDPVDRRTVIGQVADQRLELRGELGRGRGGGEGGGPGRRSARPGRRPAESSPSRRRPGGTGSHARWCRSGSVRTGRLSAGRPRCTALAKAQA